MTADRTAAPATASSAQANRRVPFGVGTFRTALGQAAVDRIVAFRVRVEP